MIALTSIFGSCMKYPDGPVLTLRSSADRLSNFWVIDKYFEDGLDVTDEFNIHYASFVWRFSKDFSFDIYGQIDGVPWSRSGEWKFVESDRSIELLNQASDSTYTFRIEKLKQKHLWLAQADTVLHIFKQWRFKQKGK